MKNLSIILMITLCSCGADTNTKQLVFLSKTTKNVAVDSETKCQYFTDKDGNPSTPRLGTDGFPMCFNQIQSSAE